MDEGDESKRGHDVTAAHNRAPAGGGRFRLPTLTIGIFHASQKGHEIALGSDRAAHRPLDAGEGWILPARADGGCRFDTDLEFTTVSIPDAALREAGIDRPSELAPVVGALDPLIVQLAETLVSGRDRPRLYRDTMARALVAQLAGTLTPVIAALPGLDDRRLRRALDLIHARIGEDLSLDELAAEAAMSPFHFARVFKGETGLSPLQYVIAERMKQAGLLLRTTRLPVAEIAFRVGYGDVSRFGQHFKRATGITPAAYRAG